jgi:hypothetical protein
MAIKPLARPLLTVVMGIQLAQQQALAAGA